MVKIGTGGLSGKLSMTRKVLIVPITCAGEGACSGSVSFSQKHHGAKGSTTLAKGTYSLASGTTSKVRVPLTKAGRNQVKSLLARKHPPKTLSGRFELNDSGRSTSTTSNRVAQLPRGN